MTVRHPRALQALFAAVDRRAPRDLAAAGGLGDGGVDGDLRSRLSRIWRAFGLKPHIVETWNLSTDPQFVAKVRAVVGIYLAPPENALVLAVDENRRFKPWTGPSPRCRWRRPRRRR